MIIFKHRTQKVAAGLAFLWLALIVGLSFAPLESFGASFPGVDKLGHLAFYGVLALLCALALPDKVRCAGIGIVGVVVLVTILGGVVEYLQAGLPDRQARGWDLAANGLGALVAAIAASRLRLRRA